MRPSLAGWDQKYKDRGLVVIDIDDGQRDTLADVQAHVKENGVTYAVLYDEGGKNATAYGVKGYPAAFLLDASGKVIWEGFPLPAVAEIEPLIEKALAKAKPPAKNKSKEKKPSQPKEEAKAPSGKEPEPVTTPSGLKYIDLVEGTGPSPAAGDNCQVHYTGWLENGTKFDSSVDRGQPFEFPIGQGRVIKGWDEGVSTMKVGGKRKLTIPASLGYGDRGAGGVIPPGATLIFEVELLGIRK